MTTNRYVSIMANLHLRNRLSTFLIALLIVSLVVESLYLVVISSRQTVVIVPKGLSQTVSVGQDEASTEYLLAMGSYVAYLFLNFDVTNVVGQYEQLSSLTSSVVRTQTFKLAEEYRTSNISSRIFVKKVTATNLEISVSGTRLKYILDKVVEEKEFTLKIKYRIEYGNFRIQELNLL
jgi:type IV conjugative transfer system protein TraE